MPRCDQRAAALVGTRHGGHDVLRSGIWSHHHPHHHAVPQHPHAGWSIEGMKS